jgi:hypothetical protein
MLPKYMWSNQICQYLYKTGGYMAKKERLIGFKKTVRVGRAKKRFGPKESKPKKYRGQGKSR